MTKIIEYYKVYTEGAEFLAEGARGDYIPADLKYMTAASLIDKQARFLFSKKPDIVIDVGEDNISCEGNKENTVYQDVIDAVMNANNLNSQLIQAARDCFIGGRVACLLNFNDDGIKLQFIPSLEFIYDMDEKTDKLNKIIVFYIIKDSNDKREQRLYKKKYWLQNGYCYVEESIYDGSGNLIEVIIPETKTLFTYIPAAVIKNGGLIGDMNGESEIARLVNGEKWINKISNADMDSLRQSMNPVRYTVDMENGSTKNLSIAAGSYWDLQTDTTKENAKGEVGVLETAMNYANPLDITVKRIKNAMHELVDVPNVTEMEMRLASGKTLKAIYWGLIVRCDEKFIAWRSALTHIVNSIIEGIRLYPNGAKKYLSGKFPDISYTVKIDNQYPLPEDEQEEKAIDLSEVNNQTMSKKAYMMKWRSLTDNEADDELKQIALERELLDNSYFGGLSDIQKAANDISDNKSDGE